MQIVCETNKSELMTRVDVMRALGGVSNVVVDKLAAAGKLPFELTASGIRIYRRKDVERIAAERAKNPPRRGRPRKR